MKTVLKFVADDGTEFLTQAECERHEELMRNHGLAGVPSAERFEKAVSDLEADKKKANEKPQQ